MTEKREFVKIDYSNYFVFKKKILDYKYMPMYYSYIINFFQWFASYGNIIGNGVFKS